MFELLALSIVAFALGPLTLKAFDATPTTRRWGRWIAAAAVAVVVLGHVLPECVEAAGPVTLGLALIGVGLPAALEGRRSEAGAPWMGLLGALALVLHVWLDGFALGLGGSGHHGHGHGAGGGLALGVVLHRLPVGAGLWWLLRERLSRRLGLAWAGIVATTTVLSVSGWAAGASLGLHLDATGVALVQAPLAGVLLHVLLDTRHRELAVS